MTDLKSVSVCRINNSFGCSGGRKFAVNFLDKTLHKYGDFMESYKTIKFEACDEFVEKRSRFIGYSKPVTTQEQAVEFINQIKSKHWDATHNVYAYVLREGSIMRYSDDGEPQGTAGVPVLDVLVKSELCDIVVVVTRYFGGILLGGGGLVRAYSHGSRIAAQAGKIITMAKCAVCSVFCSYSQYGKVNTTVIANGGIIDDTLYTDSVEIDFHIPPENIGSLNKQLADATGGECAVQIIDEIFCEID